MDVPCTSAENGLLHQSILWPLETNFKRAIDTAEMVLPVQGLAVVCAPEIQGLHIWWQVPETGCEANAKVVSNRIPSFQLLEHIQPIGVLLEVEKLDLHFSCRWNRSNDYHSTDILPNSTGFQHQWRSRRNHTLEFPFVDRPEVKDVYNL